MKKTTKQAVNKSLTPEEKAILGNIRSLLEQLDSEEISEDMDAPAIEEETIVEDATDQEEIGVDDTTTTDEEEVNKACDDPNAVKKSSTPDEVANNNAEQRLTAEDTEQRLTAEDTDVENALSVLKSFLNKKEQKVEKSAEIARLEKKVDSLAYAVEGMLAGFGMDKPRAPVQKSNRDVLARLEQIVAKSKGGQEEREGDLSDVMTTLFGNN